MFRDGDDNSKVSRLMPALLSPRAWPLTLFTLAILLLVVSVIRPGPLHAQTSITAPGNLQATAVAGGVRLTWNAPELYAPVVNGYQVLRRTSGQSGMATYVLDTGSTATGYTDRGAAKQGETYTYQVRALVRNLTGLASDSAAVTIPGTCPISGGSPVDVTVSQVPIVVTSTVDDYFVLYVQHEKGGETVDYPVLVKQGEAATTTLADNLTPLPAEKYRVKKYQVANPGDVDGDCIDDLAELADLGTKNPLNPADSVDISNGAVAIPDHAAFRNLSYQGRDVAQIDSHLRDLEYVKFIIMNPGSDRPTVYFMNTVAHRVHYEFAEDLGFDTSVDPWRNGMAGELIYHPNVVAPDGSLGVYRYDFRPWDDHAFDAVAFSFEALAASMPFLENNLAYYPVYESALPRYHREKALYDASRVNVVLENDIFPDVDFIPLNAGEGYGYLREMSLDERPNPRDIVIYETLPNDLPRVAGIITGVPQTPLSHVNLRAVQNKAPNAFIRDPLDDATIDALLDRHVYYKVTQSGYTLRAATRAEVDAHYGASRPASAQTPERDLSVTKITPLNQVGFDDWDAFGVKAANMAVLGTLGFPEGTVRDGFAVPFYFYDEFMKNAGLAEETVFGKKKWADEDKFTLPAGTKLSAVVTTMLAHPKFQTDYEIQDEMLDDLRDAIKDAQSPAWIITALEEMHAEFPAGTSLRYRSSTNNEDLPGYNGAGLYSSKTQDPDETAADGIDKSIKSVWASLWNFRAFVEREFHRIDHTKTAMGVLVHPNYSLEKANGVAVSFDPVTNRAGAYYVNTQLGEDLITNPEANSRPEEILLLAGGRYEVLVRSNLTEQGKLLMSDAQLKQLRSHLEVIHNKFSQLYAAAAGKPFAMDIEFKITSQNQLSIKQARPWVFPQRTTNQSPTVYAALADATVANESETREISLSGVFADADGHSLTVTATSSDEAVATASVSAEYSTLTVTAQGRGTATITVTAADGNGGEVADSLTVTVKTAPVVAAAISDVSELEIGGTRDISLSGVFNDADGDSLMVTAVSSDNGVATVSVAADYSALAVSGVAEGTATITVSAQDSDGNNVNDTFDVSVVKANNAPTVESPNDDATIINESGTHQVSLSGVFTDADSDNLTITAESSSTSVATASVSADYATLTVSAQSRGTANITVTAADGNGGSVEDTFTVTVKAAPVVASAIADVSELAIDATHEVSMSGVFSDADGDALTIGATTSDSTVAQVSNTIDPSTGSATAITVIGVAAGTVTITVTARDSDGNSVSDAFDVTVPAAQQQGVELPGPVGSLEVTASGENNVTVRWGAPETGGAPQGYIVHLRPENGKQGSGTTKRPGADRTTVSFNNLQSGRTYEVWVRAQNEAGKGQRVNASITLPAVLPGPVVGLVLTATADTVTVSWQAPETGGTPNGYIVHLRPQDGETGSGRTKTPKAKKTQVTFENLKPGQTYQVWVRAQNEAGKGQRVLATITLPWPVLVSNFSKEKRNSDWSTNNFVLAQGFTTGNAATTLESVEVSIRETLDASHIATVRAELWSAASGGEPGAKLVNLVVPDVMQQGDVAFSAPAGTTLSANTNYHLVLYTTGQADLRVNATSSEDEDTGGEDGWSISNVTHHIGAQTPEGGDWVEETSSGVMLMRVTGQSEQ